jgi:Flp pilus assembly protein TadD
MGFALVEGAVNDECIAEFFDVPSGEYRVTVRGADAANADEGDVEVNSLVAQDLEVRAKRTQSSDPSSWAVHATFISVKELGVPSNAAKEFEKASRLIARQDWAKATERLQKGLALYPNYAIGYNNLGAVYSYLGNNAQAREALQQAIRLDARLAPAYVNLGRLSFLEKDYSAAESLLSRAVSLAPAENAGELFLLAYSQLTDHHLDQALQTSRQAHSVKLNHHAYLHLVAANAYEQQAKIADSMSELEAYLSEEPNGIRSEKVRQVLATFQAQTTAR